MNEALTMTKKTSLKWCWLSLVIVALDQWTKYLILASFSLYEFFPILPFFNLTLIYNTGAAFSFLSEHPEIAIWLFSGIAILVSGMLVWWLKITPSGNRWLGCALALVLGGGVGNLIDRVLYGHVVDFLDFHWGGWHFPAFNVADSAVSVGAVMLFLELFVFKKVGK